MTIDTIDAALALMTREIFYCPTCAHHDDADLNAAVNIARRGLCNDLKGIRWSDFHEELCIKIDPDVRDTAQPQLSLEVAAT
jgi:hypothetical protein